MSVSRRALLRMTGGAAVSAASLRLAAPALAAPAIVGLKDLRARALSFNCCYAGEQLKNVTYWADGNYIPGALVRISHALRDVRTGEVHAIDPRVLDILHRIGRDLGGERFGQHGFELCVRYEKQ